MCWVRVRGSRPATDHNIFQLHDLLAPTFRNEQMSNFVLYNLVDGKDSSSLDKYSALLWCVPVEVCITMKYYCEDVWIMCVRCRKLNEFLINVYNEQKRLFEPIPIAGCIFISFGRLMIAAANLCMHLLMLANNGCLFALSIRLPSSASIFPITVNRHMRFRQTPFYTNAKDLHTHTHTYMVGKFSHSNSFSHFLCVYFPTMRKLYWLVPHDIAIYKIPRGVGHLFILRQAITRQFFPVFGKLWFYFGRKESALRIAIAIHHSYYCIRSTNWQSVKTKPCCCCCCRNWKESASGILSVFVLTKRNADIDRTSE